MELKYKKVVASIPSVGRVTKISNTPRRERGIIYTFFLLVLTLEGHLDYWLNERSFHLKQATVMLQSNTNIIEAHFAS